MRVFTRPKKQPTAEVNVTPCIDVIMALLVVFMVSIPSLIEGLEVQLPQTKAVAALPVTTTEIAVLTIKADGTFFLDANQSSWENLEFQLKQNVVDQNKVLYLQADKDVPYGDVVRLMGFMRTAGIRNLNVVAKPEETPQTGAQGATPQPQTTPGQARPGNAPAAPARQPVRVPARS